MTKHIITSVITSAALTAVFACNRDTAATPRTMPPADQTPIARNAPAEQQSANSPITVSGCLQKDGGLVTTYIVTAMNEPSQKGVGTSGNGAAVEREQVREAEHAYRVSTKDNVDMDTMVGKQVRVSGTIAKPADLPDLQPNQTGTTGKTEAPKTEKIDKGDLAKIDDASIEVLSDNCSGNSSKQ